MTAIATAKSTRASAIGLQISCEQSENRNGPTSQLEVDSKNIEFRFDSDVVGVIGREDSVRCGYVVDVLPRSFQSALVC